MRAINPIFLLFASMVIFFIALFSFNTTNKKFSQEVVNYTEYKALALHYNAQYDYYSNKKQILNSLQHIIKTAHISNGNIIPQDKKIIFKAKKLSLVTAHKFINKLFNNQFNIIKLDIQKDSVYVEIGYIR